MTSTLLLTALLAQAPPDIPADSVEGERIASVRVDAPATALARLTRYVELSPGEPLSMPAVRHAVELLFATGAFEDVRVEVRRGATGLDVVFIPTAAPLLRQVRVAGDRVLTARALRRLTRLQPREPLWPSRLERATKDLAQALARDGYLAAEVTPAAERAADGADAVFRINAGPRVRVGRVSLEGVSAADEAALLRLRPRSGAVFNRERVRAAAEKLRRTLVARGHWRASADVVEEYDPAVARMDLILRVEPGPLVALEFHGVHLSGGLRGRIEDLLREGALKGDVLEEAAERLEQEFRQRGYRSVVASHREESRGEGLRVIYDVEPGPVSLVASVRLIDPGAEALHVPLRTRVDSPLQDSLVEEDVRALTRALEVSGHADALVEAELREGGGQLPVAFRIVAGPRTLVGSVRVQSPVQDEMPARELHSKVGEPYRVRDLTHDRSELTAVYRNAGYLQAEAIPDVVFSEDRTEATLTLRVSPGPRTDLDHLVIAGLDATREEVVRRELRIREGEPLGLQGIIESQRRLGALGIFQRVSLAEMDPESLGRRSMVVSVQEAPRTTLAYGLGYAERDLLRVSAEVTRRNLAGLDRSLSTFARMSFRGSRLLTSYREPYLFGRRQDLFVTGFREEEDRESFDFVRFGGLVQTARSLSPRWSLILRYSLQETNVFNVEVPLEEVDRQFRNSTVSGPSASVVDDNRDDPLDPRGGHFLGADVQLSHRLLGGDSFVKGFVQAASYRRVNARVLLALSARLGLAGTLGGAAPARLPLPDRFFAGGDYGLRGFKLDTAGPLERSSSGAVVPTGGNALVLGGAELRFDAGRHVSLAVFSDIGNVYPVVSDLDLTGLRYTAGFGVRYRSALGPLRVDWGYKLNRRPEESASRLHLTIGHAF